MVPAKLLKDGKYTFTEINGYEGDGPYEDSVAFHNGYECAPHVIIGGSECLLYAAIYTPGSLSSKGPKYETPAPYLIDLSFSGQPGEFILTDTPDLIDLLDKLTGIVDRYERQRERDEERRSVD